MVSWNQKTLCYQWVLFKNIKNLMIQTGYTSYTILAILAVDKPTSNYLVLKVCLVFLLLYATSRFSISILIDFYTNWCSKIFFGEFLNYWHRNNFNQYFPNNNIYFVPMLAKREEKFIEKWLIMTLLKLVVAQLKEKKLFGSCNCFLCPDPSVFSNSQ